MLLADLADLVVPQACAGCAAAGVRLSVGVCTACADRLEALRPFRTAPVPPPAGMPPCVALGTYDGALRGVLLAYKEKGRHRLARPLGTLLAAGVAEMAPRRVPVTLVPVPSTAASARERHGDHMARLGAHAVRRLREAGWEAHLSRPLEALPRADSTSLTVIDRASAAENSLRIRRPRIGVLRRGAPRKGTLVVVDDLVTTGATLSAATSRLEEANMQVTGAVVVAATRLRRRNAEFTSNDPSGPPERRNLRYWSSRTRGDGKPSAR